jgi:translation initiation factor 1
MNKDKIPTDGGRDLAHNPFAALGGLGLSNLPAGPVAQPQAKVETVSAPAKNRGRVDVLRSTAGRGGKTVTVAKNFTGIGLPEKESLCKKMRSAAGCGGTVKDGQIEIQGDQRDVVARILTEAGFRPVMAGG